MSGHDMILKEVELPVKGGRLKKVVGYRTIAVPVRHTANLLMWLKSPEFTRWFFQGKKGDTQTKARLQKNIKKDLQAHLPVLCQLLQDDPLDVCVHQES